MLPQIVMNADVGQWFRDLGATVSDTLFHPSGWTIPDDTDTGISFGEAIDGGGGYMEMDLRDIRRSDRQPLYQLRGFYVEFGIGIGEISKLQGFINRIVKWMPKGARPGSDFVVLPGGSLSQFIMGPMNSTRNLEIGDFRFASWLYVHVGAEVAVLAGDIGLMFMLDHNLKIDTIIKAAGGKLSDALVSLLANCIAWAPYWGVALGLGAGGKYAVRYIQTVQMSNA